MRIPTVLGLMVLVLGLGAGLYLVGQATIVPRAAAGETPEEIKVTNVADDSFTISWVTDIATTGFVRYGSAAQKLDTTVADDRDQLSGEVGAYATHHVTLTGLGANTEYYFKLGSGTKRVLYDNSGQPYSVATAPSVGTPPPADTVHGKVLASETVPAEGAIVYLTLPNAAPLSALVKASGDWFVPLSTSRSDDLTAFVDYDRQASILELFVQAGEDRTATAVTVTGNDSPVPPITLGQAYDFRSEATLAEGGESQGGNVPEVEDETADEASEAARIVENEQDTTESGPGPKFSLEPLEAAQPEESSYELEILNPEEEGEEVTTVKPEIFGTSPKNVTLTITVESETTYDGEVVVGDDGLWQWTPPAGLEPGEHTVTVSYIDVNGIFQEVKRSFVVLAAEESDLPSFEATPSASTAPSPTPSPTPKPTASPSATPSAPPRVSQPSTASGVPESGVLTPTLIMFILGSVLLSAGVFWQLKVRQI